MRAIDTVIKCDFSKAITRITCLVGAPYLQTLRISKEKQRHRISMKYILSRYLHHKATLNFVRVNKNREYFKIRTKKNTVISADCLIPLFGESLRYLCDMSCEYLFEKREFRNG